jgi:hypothetical protein
MVLFVIDDPCRYARNDDKGGDRMTCNEEIAEKMGWDSDSQGLHVLETWDEQPEYNKLYLVKLLQQRMVEDGFRVKIWHTGDGVYADATSGEGDNFKWHACSKREGWDNTEPAAIVELFCKVYGIEDK